MDVVNSAPLTSDFIYSPHFRAQAVKLNAQASAVPRGTIICVKSSLPLSASFSGTAATISPTASFTGTEATISPTASFTGTEAALSGDAENYTPAGSVSVTGASYTPAGSVSVTGASYTPAGSVTLAAGASADGSFDVIGAGDGAYAQPYGVLLEDAPASGALQSVELVVIGELFKDYVEGVYKAANSGTPLSAATLVALRNIGIILK